MAAQTQVVNLILNRLTAHLTQVMTDEVPVGDATRADVVKKGLLQVEKLQKNVQLGITGGDHEDVTYTDGIVDLDKMPNIGFIVPAREVGGGQMWWRRGVVKVEIFLTPDKLKEDDAHTVAYNILGRLQEAIEQLDLSGCVDSFGERAIKIFCFGNTFFESGGPPNQFIFRGKVLWQVLTERP